MACPEQLFFTNDFWDNLRRLLDINTLAILVDHYFNSPLSLFLGVFFGFFLFLIVMTYFTALCLRTKIRTVQEQQQRFLSYVHPDFSEVKDVKDIGFSLSIIVCYPVSKIPKKFKKMLLGDYKISSNAGIY